MAENIPPTNGATMTSTAANDASSRGLPYYEKLRRDLRDLLARKPLHDKNLASIESSIYSFETSYLEETTAGNIIKGFDNYIKGATSTSSGGALSSSSSTINNSSANASANPNAINSNNPSTRRKAVVSDADRIFSRSSVDYASLLKEEGAASTPGSAATTPGASHANTPVTATAAAAAGQSGNSSAAASVKGGGGGGGGSSKNNKKRGSTFKDEDETTDGGGSGTGGGNNKNKRVKVSFSRGGAD